MFYLSHFSNIYIYLYEYFYFQALDDGNDNNNNNNNDDDINDDNNYLLNSNNNNNTLNINRRLRKRNQFNRITGNSRNIIGFDPSLIFQPNSYRNIAAEAVLEYMNNRELSKDPAIRQISHFEGYLSSQDFNSMIARTIPNDDIEIMKKVSYRILEFGQFNWNQVITAFKVYKSYYGDLNITDDYIINDEILDLNIGYDDNIEGMLLGEALKSIRIGDIDGLEDEERRKQLDELGFDWGDKKLYQRYRFVPMLLGQI